MLAKDAANAERLDTVLNTMCEALRAIAVLYNPVMPKAMSELWSQLGADASLGPIAEQPVQDAGRWGQLPPGSTVTVYDNGNPIGTAVADRMTHRLSHLVYVDAVVPKPGEAWGGTHSRATQESRLKAAQASPDFAFPPPGASLFGLDGPQADWVNRRQTPHPAHP